MGWGLTPGAARQQGKRLEELEELDQSAHPKDGKLSLADRVKTALVENMPNLGFWFILMFASIPNPLFDFAGISCGHMLVPFRTFFGATLIGKSFIKANLQTVFVIAISMQRDLIDVLFGSYPITLLDPFVARRKNAACTSVAGCLHNFLKTIETHAAAEKVELGSMLQGGVDWRVLADPRTWLSWNAVVGAIVGAFVIHMINATVQGRLMEEEEGHRFVVKE